MCCEDKIPGDDGCTSWVLAGFCCDESLQFHLDAAGQLFQGSEFLLCVFLTPILILLNYFIAVILN